jgi:hypothetical protein
MSIILDALRSGRDRQNPAPNPNASQTDAVMQTLGYAPNAAPSNRAKRVFGYLALAVVVAIVLWVTIVGF